jgi:hypothetical protein
MGYPTAFLHLENFRLAFRRVVRGGNKEYKQFYRHLFPSYGLGLDANLKHLVAQLRANTYRPQQPTVVYQPKKSGVLRPLTLLSLDDLILYQAIANIIAKAFEGVQKEHALQRSFGAIFAGAGSDFFYRSWRKSYAAYSNAVSAAFVSGNDYVADFDLVSFYDLIDHILLKNRLSARVNSRELLDLLTRCLREWTPGLDGHHVNHGVPQGPEPSAFLAECLLFAFDGLKLPGVRYYRYVDDIKLMAKDEVPIRRALLRLDLQSKQLGLVPQAQKIDCRRVADIKEVLKSIPSGLASAVDETEPDGRKKEKVRQRDLLELFNRSIQRNRGTVTVEDQTEFKFSLYRLEPRRPVLRRIAPLLVQRPDLSWILAAYIRRFPQDAEAANILLDALRRDPTYDASAANYIDAMDVCEPSVDQYPFRRVIQTATSRSEEKSITLRIAAQIFRGRRASVSEAIKLIRKEPHPLVKGILIHRLFGSHPTAPFQESGCEGLLQELAQNDDPDLSRFSAGLLLREWPWRSWKPPAGVNDSVVRLLVGLGVRKRAPKRQGILDTFFQVHQGIGMKLTWSRALKSDFREAEKRCLRFQSLQFGDPTARLLALDTFNEILLQNFCTMHPTLRTAYAAAAGKKKHPDYGNLVHNGHVVTVLPKATAWFQKIHKARSKSDLAHTRDKTTGVLTRPIDFKKASELMKGSTTAWAELISEWKKLL